MTQDQLPPAPDYDPLSLAAWSPRQRLLRARWVLMCVVAILLVGVLAYGVPLWLALLSLLVSLLVAAFMPNRRGGANLATRSATQDMIWPDTGMKVIVDALPHPCFVVDRRGVTRYVNQLAMERFSSVKPGDPLSFALRAPALVEGLDRVSHGGATERISWAEKVPTDCWFEAHMAPVSLPGSPLKDRGRPDFVLVSVLDLTEHRRLERMRADFVANASHELRTPLASLTGFIETLQGPAREDPKARDRFLAIMLEQSERMARLIDDLLSLSRIELKGTLPATARVDLRDVARSVLDAMGPMAADQNVVLEQNLPDEPAVVAGERDELVQVLNNLTENALKYGGSGGKVEISCRRRAVNGAGTNGIPADAAEWTLAVRDWGPGIASEHIPRLTERFYRVDDNASREMKGTGLGLAIVKHVLNRHRARLEITSEPGRGAVFAVHMKAVPSRNPQADSL